MNPLKIKFWLIAIISLLMIPAIVQAHPGDHRTADGKLKVLYHIDGPDIGVAKYAMALINKHIEAEGGPDKIDVKVVIHGPALHLFDKEKLEPGLKKKFDLIIEKGVKPEMCQVSMKAFKKPLESLATGLVPTEHPVAVKRIADLLADGYLYIKP
jgi:intracellular sulfur oxidation DsrE/DsrF family protein